jgi:hypothetical protein
MFACELPQLFGSQRSLYGKLMQDVESTFAAFDTGDYSISPKASEETHPYSSKFQHASVDVRLHPR